MTDFWETFHYNFFNTLSRFLPESNESKSPKKYSFIFHVIEDAWPGACILALRLIIQHTTYYTTATSKKSFGLIQIDIEMELLLEVFSLIKQSNYIPEDLHSMTLNNRCLIC